MATCQWTWKVSLSSDDEIEDTATTLAPTVAMPVKQGLTGKATTDQDLKEKHLEKKDVAVAEESMNANGEMQAPAQTAQVEEGAAALPSVSRKETIKVASRGLERPSSQADSCGNGAVVGADGAGEMDLTEECLGNLSTSFPRMSWADAEEVSQGGIEANSNGQGGSCPVEVGKEKQTRQKANAKEPKKEGEVQESRRRSLNLHGRSRCPRR
eukprot:TRINITY_DN69789_c0_g1_i1.p4 TRINITY_DN69789_c0_g1~~TRINITY_DN69789_c0_g1_i1.p4  ORF type:complete len:249 (-),score=58.24 TRINITY_DN69789_c0_g1_i1:1308-1943(-)